MSEVYEKYLAIVSDPANLAELSIIGQHKLPILQMTQQISEEEYIQILKAAYQNLSGNTPLKSGDSLDKPEFKKRLELVFWLLSEDDNFEQSCSIRLSENADAGLYVCQRIGAVTHLPNRTKNVAKNAVYALILLDIKFELVE